MNEEEKRYLEQQLAEKHRWFNKGSRSWSTAHHWSLGISAVTSACAAVVIKLKWLEKAYPDLYTYREDAAALLAALATIITAVSAAGNFGRKWQTNRISRGKIERLQIMLSNPAVSADTVREELLDVMKRHEEGIIGTPIK
ncbi:hypothetical protein [Undibacterium terreum]|uniref:SMODS and SLOG-associating 2TM effector domain-containing protein n=1 Tax=Undibacterium terreum TaxID=1224302 RepID=A0A916XL93_9BURK|nr:hypothetical protein [Undibacterium terreum]GGC79492.1 hypothetical protein GCM10011396_28430 [Undibacterium terreum]